MQTKKYFLAFPFPNTATSGPRHCLRPWHCL